MQCIDPSIVETQRELVEFRIKHRHASNTEDDRKYQSNRDQFRKIIKEKNLVRKTYKQKDELILRGVLECVCLYNRL